ncbi:MAG: hydroxymethylglutaryl-CoA reductase, degradative [bacterium]
MTDFDPQAEQLALPQQKTSRIPRFYRLSVEQRLAYLARSFGLSNTQIAELRNGQCLRIRHAVNMVENAVGVFGLPLGLGLNFLVDGKEHLVPMAIEEASIIAAASKAALLIRKAGGFLTEADDPVMIGQIQLLDVADIEAAVRILHDSKSEILAAANRPNERMVKRGGGAFEIETRVLTDERDGSRMLVLHLLIDVREAMGANAVNYSCEAAGSLAAELCGGRSNLRIVSNYADRRLARASFRLPFEILATAEMDGEMVARRMVEAGRMARIDPYRAATHNKGIFNGIDAAAIALGQDWRAIEAGGHAHAARSGQYRGLTEYEIDGNELLGRIELPLQVGWVGGAVNSHPGVKVLRRVSGVENARELASLLAAVGLGQNFAACLALATDGIQKGHMALHARSVAISVGVPSQDVEEVAQRMIALGDVKVATAERVHRELQDSRMAADESGEMPIETWAPGKVVLFGEHATVYGQPGITASIDVKLKCRIQHDPAGPRFLQPTFREVFEMPESDLDIRLFSQVVDEALATYGLQQAPIAIAIESELVPGMGLGSSAACSVALCTALRRYAGLEHQRRLDNSLFEEVQKLESIYHGSPSGMDAATVLNGGVLWFRSGPPRETLSIRVPVQATGIICIVEPGARTIELVQQVRHSRELNQARVDKILSRIGEITALAGAALGGGNLEQVGALMNENHELLADLGVSTEKLDSAVELLRSMGAFGAKLTGAGGGGAVIALVSPEKRYQMMQELATQFPLVLPFELGSAS